MWREILLRKTGVRAKRQLLQRWVMVSAIGFAFSTFIAGASTNDTAIATRPRGEQTTETQKGSFVVDLEDVYRSVGATQEQIERLRSLNARIQQARKEHNLAELESLKRERANLLTLDQKRMVVHTIRRHFEMLASPEATVNTTTQTATVRRP